LIDYGEKLMLVLPVRNVKTLLMFLMIIWIPCRILAENPAVSVDISGDRAEATYLEGSVFRVGSDDTLTKISVNRGDFLDKGIRFHTDKDSKLELKLPDDSFIRFNELTTFELTSVGYDAEQQRQNIRVNMILGNTWANVSKFFKTRRSFEISTKTAVMGVRGTVYRVNVQQDDTVIVKVYWGEVLVNSKPASDMKTPDAGLKKPSKVLGPTPIPGPKTVSLEEWTYIVKSMQQIIVHPDGKATEPFGFSAEQDLDDWVRWNQQRDDFLNKN